MLKVHSLLWALCLVQTAFGGWDDRYCCLCEECDIPPRATLYVGEDYLTCDQLNWDYVDIDPTSNKCATMKNTYRTACCDLSVPAPDPVAQEPVPSPASQFPQGSNDICHLCLNEQFPEKPYTVTAVLYIDDPPNPTCEDLYWMGLTGNIPNRICYPMQDYMEDPCGCNIEPSDPWWKPSWGDSDDSEDDSGADHRLGAVQQILWLVPSTLLLMLL